MDGLSISTAQGLVKQGKTVSELQSSRMQNGAGAPSDVGSKSFAATLGEAVDKVNSLQVDADNKTTALATGKSKNIPETLIAMEKADIGLRLMMQVRNKIIDAYQEIMKMQV